VGVSLQCRPRQIMGREWAGSRILGWFMHNRCMDVVSMMSVAEAHRRTALMRPVQRMDIDSARNKTALALKRSTPADSLIVAVVGLVCQMMQSAGTEQRQE